MQNILTVKPTIYICLTTSGLAKDPCKDKGWSRTLFPCYCNKEHYWYIFSAI